MKSLVPPNLTYCESGSVKFNRTLLLHVVASRMLSGVTKVHHSPGETARRFWRPKGYRPDGAVAALKTSLPALIDPRRVVSEGFYASNRRSQCFAGLRSARLVQFGLVGNVLCDR
jgi:hypothetical protein